jgi:hypothetical protein
MGGCHYEPIGGIAVKSRGQTVYRDYDLSIERQNRQNSRFRRVGQPVGGGSVVIAEHSAEALSALNRVMG